MDVNKEEIKRLREGLPLNVLDMAAKIKVTPQTIHRIERTGKASWGNIKKLARAYGVDLKQIVRKGEPV